MKRKELKEKMVLVLSGGGGGGREVVWDAHEYTVPKPSTSISQQLEWLLMTCLIVPNEWHHQHTWTYHHMILRKTNENGT